MSYITQITSATGYVWVAEIPAEHIDQWLAHAANVLMEGEILTVEESR